MSLEVSINGEPHTEPCVCHCGHEHGHTVAPELYGANITHNLGAMAQNAGIYEHLWRPEQLGITKARQLIEPLTKGLALMNAEPDRFKALASANGWGTYEHFVPFVANYLAACIENPDGNIQVSR